jgi:putative cardiolipin synthase
MDTAITTNTTDAIRTGKSGLMLVADSADALAIRMLSARDARESLDLMYYLWHDDRTGRLLLREVVSAADRGVKVRMLLDDINPRASDAAYLAINSHPNIELRLFNPSRFRNGHLLRMAEFAWHMLTMTRRMHTKAWIADGKVAIVGGRNIGDAYFDAADTNFRDLDMLMCGPAVDQTTAIFESFWTSEAARPIAQLHPRIRARRADPIAEHVDAEAVSAGHPDCWQSLDEFVAARGSMRWTRSARVVSDPPQKVWNRWRRSWLSRELLPLIRNSTRRLEIVSPYFIPGTVGSHVLADLVRRGVEVTVLTNSLAATDVAAVHGAYARYRVRLLKAGIKLFELQPFGGRRDMSVFGSKGASLHTKAFVVDGRVGFVGSFNFDPRSISLNAEMGVTFDDENLAGELAAWCEREKSPQKSYQVHLSDGRLSWEGECDAEITRLKHEPDASLFRRMVAGLTGWLPVESQL